jgi:phosphatidylserine/phosphatidylglycerophosphate/cardiolipin synthase-like enzyme
VFNTLLIHRAGEDPVEVVPASAITDQFAFWQHELLKAGPSAHAIIHDKIVVIDPMSDDCVVITGSHNLGYRASYNNDENLLIVRGHNALAQAYAVHVMDIYDHYRFRYTIQKAGTQAFAGLEPDDKWQDKYFDPADPASHDADVWFEAVGSDDAGHGDAGHDEAGHEDAAAQDQPPAPPRHAKPKPHVPVSHRHKTAA